MSRRRGEFRYMQVNVLYMHVACLVCVCEYITNVWITHQASSFILQRPVQHPLKALFSSLSLFFHPFFFFTEASVVWGCQVISLPVQIMTVIKQLRPERQRGQELASLTHLNRRQMRIHQGIQALWLWHMFFPLVLIAISHVKGQQEQAEDDVNILKYILYSAHACQTLFFHSYLEYPWGSVSYSNLQDHIVFVTANTVWFYIFETKEYLQNNLLVMECFHSSTNLRYWGFFFLAAWIAFQGLQWDTGQQRWDIWHFQVGEKSKLALHSEITQVLKLLTALKQ